MIICFSGWKGSGKDECAKYLIERHNAIRVALADPLKDSVAQEFGINRASLDDPKRKESPLLNLPVDPKDKYSKMIAKFLVKEFRNKNGAQAHEFDEETNEGIVHVVKLGDGLGNRANIIEETKDRLYWTPRALAILKGSTNRSVASNYWTGQAFGVMEAELKEDPNRVITVTDVRYKSELAQFKERFGDNVVFVRVNRFKESPSSDPSERDLDDGKFDFYLDNTGTLENLHGQIERLFGPLGI